VLQKTSSGFHLDGVYAHHLSWFVWYICSGGLRLKRDVSEYAEFVRSFKAPAVDEKFELLGT
jgi:hypothetical protein